MLTNFALQAVNEAPFQSWWKVTSPSPGACLQCLYVPSHCSDSAYCCLVIVAILGVAGVLYWARSMCLPT